MKKIYAGSYFEIIMLLLQIAAFIVCAWIWFFIRPGMNRYDWIVFLLLLIVPYYSFIIFVFFRARVPFFTWVLFTEEYLVIYTLFCKKKLFFTEVKGCGIGSYMHGTFIGLGKKRFFVFISDNEFDNSFRNYINRWNPNGSRYVKISINKKRYESIISYFPSQLRKIIRQDFINYVCKTENWTENKS